MAFKPCDSFCIEMVCRFVQKQNVRFLQKKTAQSNTAAFSSRKDINNLVWRRAAECVHCKFKIIVQIPGICGIEFFLNFCLACTKFVKIGVRIAKSFVNFIKFFKKVCNRFNAFFYYFKNSFSWFKIRFLFKIAH